MSTVPTTLSFNAGSPVSDAALDQIFRQARTFTAWLPKPVSQDLLRQAVQLALLAPTSANSSPARFVFVTSPEAKARLKPALAPGNVDKTMAAPATAIIAWDTEFYEHLPRLFPQADIRQYFVGNAKHAEESAFRNGSLQGAYFILAARALGLDCGPMGGFNHGGIDAEFFAGTEIKSNFLCNLGYGAPGGWRPRNERLSFDEACRII